MSEKVIIRPFKQDDLNAVLSLMKNVFRSARSFDEEKKLWEWKHYRNPYSKNAVHAYVLEHNENIVGTIGQIPTIVKIGAEKIPCLSACDFCVANGYKTYGLLLANQFWKKNPGAFLTSTSVNNNAFPVHALFGAKELVLGRYFWFRARHPFKLLKMYLARSSDAVSEVSSNPTLSSIRATKNLLKATNRSSGSGITVDEIPYFSRDFDNLWSDLSSGYGISIVRDSEYLNWRYVDYPMNKVKLFAAYDKADLTGFSAVATSERDSLKFAHITELFTRRGDSPAQQALLDSMLKYSKSEDVDLVVASILPSSLWDLAERNLFVKTESQFSRYLYQYPSRPDLTKDEKSWFVSPGDGDVAY